MTIDGETTTVSEGVYCNDFVINNLSIVTFSPGIYVIRDGKFEVNSGGTIIGDGVTFYITGSAEFILNSNSHAELTAPTTGPLAGIIIFQDRSVADGTIHLFNSDSSSFFVGTIYMPNGKVMINSGSSLGGPAAFTSFVARKFEINSDSSLVLNSDYGATDVPFLRALGGFQVALFE